MTFEEIEQGLEELRVERLRIAPVNYGNYRQVLAAYQHILNDQLVLNRNLARNCVELMLLVVNLSKAIPSESEVPTLPVVGSFQ